MKISDEQYAKVGVACGWAEAYAVEQGKRAVAAVAPLILAEPTDDEICKLGSVRLWDATDFGRCKAAFRDRLASLTAKPDPAVEAVKALLKGTMSTAACDRAFCDETAPKIVAAVDAARGGK